ncbi:bifunctional lysylphosphatidylglycerol flippase/synthetase MprF [Azoarcus sp. TTM-91]|uniref:bifunctional lysylphosphatidylglycerol flippase/synthetase MprF n=1 Tax=Azoarcus sp. TTM-91 TaxID=2691581 RepID=UPI00145D670C|nr:bifunctional lysylphosphatidylglycerol flippase/synthetase MprF [Azoarcus sp. TTM-91]NMG36140.1 bifunctional lysylphosphatidylglycerol flippase/synthetase MprF [Azoarcus sp. TTM-91]
MSELTSPADVSAPPSAALAALAALRRLALPAIVVLVLALAWFAFSRLMGEVSYADLKAALDAVPATAIAAALVCTILSFAALTVYDLGALEFVGRKPPRVAVALTSFCAYAVGNTAGFGPLTAGAIRYRFYTPHGVEPDEVARIIAFVSLAFGLGLAGMAGLGLIAAARDFAMLPLPPQALQLLGGLIVALLAGLCFVVGQGRALRLFGHELRLPSRRLILRQFLATAVDVSASAAALWVLLPADSISLPAFIAVYAVAIGLGVLSHVPAGLGVFETVIVAALSSQVAPEKVLGALVLYRVIYHLVPLALAVLLITGLEARRAAASPLVSAALRAGKRLAPPLIGAFTLVLGALLIFSGVTPVGDEPLELLGAAVPLPLVEGAHFLASVLGVVLLIVARGLVYRLDGAWWLAIFIVPLSMVLALVKALALGEVLLLAALFAALLASRKSFSRQASLLHQALTPGWLAAVATLMITAVALLLFVYKDVAYTNELWWQFEFYSEAPRSLRALLGVLLTASVGAGWILLRPAARASALPTAEELAQARRIVAAQPRVDAGLVAMGDKSLLFSEDGRAFIMYGRQGRSWVALSDPVGPRECWSGLVWRFVEMARQAGGRAAFYQVAPDSLALYADAGLMAFKLGEEARVSLPGFDLKGAKRANLRQALNKAEREGLVFEVVGTAEVGGILPELQAVSDAWMGHHQVREKRFSLGAFEPDYVCSQPVAVLKQAGHIVAFATLLTTELKEEASIDLMRFLPGAPNGVMDVLLLRLILHFQGEGYAWFTLGMAPLSGLSGSEAAPVWHRVGRAVFEHGERFYNFSGLRAFKAKFQPEWQPRYLAVSGGINPMLALADITVLISGGLKGVIGK